MTSKKDHKISIERIDQLRSFLVRLKVDSGDFLSENSKLDFNLINEALTHTSAESKYNHERLEFLGDAVLRLAASEFIDWKFPDMKVGERSALRAQLVSDNWLTKVGNNINIEEVLIVGPKAMGDKSAINTLQAEATEALIGAIYESFKELKIIQKWLIPYWTKTSVEVLNDPHRHNSKSALQEWSQSNGLQLPRYENKEISKIHGDPKRFFCQVHMDQEIVGEGWGGSRKDAEKAAATLALKNIQNINNT